MVLKIIKNCLQTFIILTIILTHHTIVAQHQHTHHITKSKLDSLLPSQINEIYLQLKGFLCAPCISRVAMMLEKLPFINPKGFQDVGVKVDIKLGIVKLSLKEDVPFNLIELKNKVQQSGFNIQEGVIRIKGILKQKEGLSYLYRYKSNQKIRLLTDKTFPPKFKQIVELTVYFDASLIAKIEHSNSNSKGLPIQQVQVIKIISSSKK